MIQKNQLNSNIDINKSYDNFINNIQQKKISNKKEKKIKKENEINTFQSLIEEVLPEKKEPELHQLWLELPEVERKLIQSSTPNEETLEQYKQIVQKIARLLIEKNLKLETIKRKTTSGKEMLLSYVKVIDIKLHKMMLALQSKQNTAFEILRNLKEIRGLLLDLKQ